MFIKITKSKGLQYVQIVKSYRSNGKTKHDLLCNLGRLDQLTDNQAWQKIAISFAKLTGLQQFNDTEGCSEANILNWGYLIYKKLWEKFKLNIILKEEIQTKHNKLQFDLNSSSFLMVIQHLLCPSSKLATFNKQQNYINLPKVQLNHLYRSLDILCAEKNAIESHVFNMNRKLYNMQVDVVFYDVTTFHFESVKKDSLKDFGFSKNNKLNEVQVVFSMYIDRDGRPVGYELFSGNTFEGKTLECALEAIEKKFGIRNVIIVADRGINSKFNLKKIVDKKYGYIFSSRIKNMSKIIQEEIFNKNGYVELSKNPEDKYCYKIIDYINKVKDTDGEIKLPEKLIVTYSTKRARKDKADRKRFLDKANFLLQNKSLIKSSSKRGGKKYLKETSKTDWVLDSRLITKDEQFDGFYGIQTNTTNLSVEEILDAYHGLWKIEESFKIMKSTLEVRPIFHWTENRIKGHFVICFLAFLLERTLELKLKHAEIVASVQNIRDAINSLQFAEVEFNKKKFFIKTKNTELASKILRNLKIPPPKNITLSTNLNI